MKKSKKLSEQNPPLSFGVVNCLVVIPTHFNPNNSLLIILQISFLFMYTPALNTEDDGKKQAAFP